MPRDLPIDSEFIQAIMNIKEVVILCNKIINLIRKLFKKNIPMSYGFGKLS